MTTLLFVAAPHTEADPVVSLELLPHQVVTAVGTDGALSGSVGADLILLDGRTDLSWARTACQACRSAGLMAPVIVLLRAAALPALAADWGLTDFILEKAEPAEWEARIRLATYSAETGNLIAGGPIEIDEAAYSATLDGRPLDLTYTEFELLKYLVLNPGRVLSREVLLSEVWGYDYYGGTRTVDVHIRRLRAKLGIHDSCISTVRNVGYRFTSR